LDESNQRRSGKEYHKEEMLTRWEFWWRQECGGRNERKKEPKKGTGNAPVKGGSDRHSKKKQEKGETVRSHPVPLP